MRGRAVWRWARMHRRRLTCLPAVLPWWHRERPKRRRRWIRVSRGSRSRSTIRAEALGYMYFRYDDIHRVGGALPRKLLPWGSFLLDMQQVRPVKCDAISRPPGGWMGDFIMVGITAQVRRYQFTWCHAMVGQRLAAPWELTLTFRGVAPSFCSRTHCSKVPTMVYIHSFGSKNVASTRIA